MGGFYYTYNLLSLPHLSLLSFVLVLCSALLSRYPAILSLCLITQYLSSFRFFHSFILFCTEALRSLEDRSLFGLFLLEKSRAHQVAVDQVRETGDSFNLDCFFQIFRWFRCDVLPSTI